MNEFELVWEKVRELTGWRHQKELAKFLGIAQPNVTEAKRRGVFRPGWIEKVAVAYGVPVESLRFDPRREAEAWQGDAVACLPMESRDSRFVQAVVEEVESAQAAERIALTSNQKAQLAGFLFDWPVCGDAGQVDGAYVRALVRLLAGV